MNLTDILSGLILAVAATAAAWYVWRHVVGVMGNTHRCTGCDACENRSTCDPKERAEKLRKAGLIPPRQAANGTTPTGHAGQNGI